MFSSLRLHGLYSPWNSPGQNNGVGSHSQSKERMVYLETIEALSQFLIMTSPWKGSWSEDKTLKLRVWKSSFYGHRNQQELQ